MKIYFVLREELSLSICLVRYMKQFRLFQNIFCIFDLVMKIMHYLKT